MASIKDLKRMCNNYPKCKNCPMSEYMCAPECAPEDLPDNADEIAANYHVSIQTVNNIITGKAWRE